MYKNNEKYNSNIKVIYIMKVKYNIKNIETIQTVVSPLLHFVWHDLNMS